MTRVRRISDGALGYADRYKQPQSIWDWIIALKFGLTGITINDWVVISDDGWIETMNPADYAARFEVVA